MKISFLESLDFFPEHRAQLARRRSISLDRVFEEARAARGISAGVFDLVLMGYRYGYVFEEFAGRFLEKNLKPANLLDLWQSVFGALLSRDRQPAAILVSEAVIASRTRFGEQTAGITNAFLRQVTREKEEIQARLTADPGIFLGPSLRKRWAAQPDLLRLMGTQVGSRPPAGITAFDVGANFSSHPVRDLVDTQQPLQAMDAGSWAFLKWLTANLKEDAQEFIGADTGEWRILDACAAPGAKLIGLTVLLCDLLKSLQAESSLGRLSIHATDAQFDRLARLRQGLERWQASWPFTIHTALHSWGEKNTEALPISWPQEFDLILADLPCSNSGILHSRPDLLFEDLGAEVKSLKNKHFDILQELRGRLAPGGKLIVCISSVDPEEIANVSEALGGAAPAFSSLTGFQPSETETREGVTAWLL